MNYTSQTKRSILFLIYPLYFSLFMGVLIEISRSFSDSYGAILYRLNFSIVLLFYLLILISNLKFIGRLNFSKFEKKIIYTGILFFTYSLFSIVISVINNNPMLYIFSDFFRSQTMYIVLIGLILYLKSKNRETQECFIDYFLITTFVITLIYMLVKVFLLLTGTVYGDGLSQFMIFPHVLVLTTLYYFRLKISVKKILIFILIIFGLGLAILSFKRSIWITIILIFFLMAIFTNRKISLSILFFQILLISILALDQFNYLDSIIYRFESTFFGDSGRFDNSTSGRIAEIKGVIYSINRYYANAIIYVTGLGNGALYNMDPSYLVGDSMSLYGSSDIDNHHVHPMPFLILIRHGAIGLIIYSYLLFLFLKRTFILYKIYSFSQILSNKYGLICVAITIEVILTIVQSLAGNAFYGSFYMGTLLFIYILSYQRFRGLI